MQNKGLIKFLTWTFGLACLFQLSFTVVTSVVESKAKTHAETYANSKTAQNEIQSLQQAGSKLTVEEIKDSIVKSEEAKYLNDKANKNVYLGYTYRECQSREINLGLDLKGGMNVMLEVSTSDVVRALANNPNDPLVNSAIDSALKAQKRSTNTDFVTLFEEEIVKLDKNVSLYQKFGSGDLRDKIQPNASNKEVVDAIRKETSEAYERT